MPKAHTLTLNNGAVHQFAQILGAPGLLTEPADLYRAGQVLEEQLLELPALPDLPKGADEMAGTKLVREWQRAGAHRIELSERQRETGKKAVQAACGKGVLPPGPGSLRLLTEFGLGDGE